eukprot:14597835-Alexandrium_andersonii.AAC.1
MRRTCGAQGFRMSSNKAPPGQQRFCKPGQRRFPTPALSRWTLLSLGPSRSLRIFTSSGRRL